MTEEKNESLWRRWSRKYLLSVVHEETLTERFHVRLNLLSVFTFFTLMFLLTLALFSLLILYTPIKNVLPGYGEDIRRSLISETARVDSLGTTLEAQRRYLSSMKQVLAGEAVSDTIISLDSLQLVMREELLLAKNAATEEFIAEYEQKEKDNLQLFDVLNNQPVYTIFRPAHGVVTETYSPELNRFGIQLQTPRNENVTAVLAGTIVLVEQEEDNTYTMMMQHAQHLSIYRNVGHPMRRVGEVVQAGETIGLAADENMLGFELWLDGRSINPEEVIAF
jgi:hypothetical protein